MSDGTNRFEILNLKDPQLRKMAILLGLGLFGVLLIFAGNLWPSASSQPAPEEPVPQVGSATGLSGGPGDEIALLESALENSLAQILSQIEGAGKVAVRVTLAGGRRYLYERDSSTTAKTTEERDSQGGTRVITERTENGELVLVRESSSAESPVVYHVIQAQIAGVLVVAEGAANSRVKGLLVEAVKTLLQVAPHRVEVLPMKGGN